MTIILLNVWCFLTETGGGSDCYLRQFAPQVVSGGVAVHVTQQVILWTTTTTTTRLSSGIRVQYEPTSLLQFLLPEICVLQKTKQNKTKNTRVVSTNAWDLKSSIQKRTEAPVSPWGLITQNTHRRRISVYLKRNQKTERMWASHRTDWVTDLRFYDVWSFFIQWLGRDS